MVGLIGGNGAGKTTFLNLVTGYLKPTSGTVRFQGSDITGMAPRRITRLGICRSFQIPQVFDTLTAYENLLVGLGIVAMGRSAFVGATWRRRAPSAVADEMLERFHLARVPRRAGLGAARGGAQAARHRHGAGGEAGASCCSTSRPAASRPTRSSRSWTWCSAPSGPRR